MKKILQAIGALALCVMSSDGHAASSDWVNSGDTRMRLVVAEPQAGATKLRGALQVELAPGWKTYWQDPGEAGVPLQLDLAGSKNVALRAIHYPAPLRFDDGVTVWAGYKEPVWFPIELERPEGAATAHIQAAIFIGICDQICVPFQTNLSVNVENASASTADQMAVQAAFDGLPGPASEEFGVSSMSFNGKTIQLNAALRYASASPELFLVSPDGWQFGTPKLVRTAGLEAVFEADVIFAPQDSVKEDIDVSYTLVTAHDAVTGVSRLSK